MIRDQLFISVLFKDIWKHNLIDPALQDNVLIGHGIFPYIYHVGSNFNLHSIVSNGLIPGGQNLRQKTIGVLLACWSKKWRPQRSRVYRLLCTASRTILAKCIEKTLRYGILGRYWSWNQRRIVLSDKIERNYSSRNTSSPLHCKSWKIWENGEKLYERQYLSPRPPPKISLKHDLNWSKGKDQGCTVEHWPVGKIRSTVTWKDTSIWFFQANPIS